VAKYAHKWHNQPLLQKAQHRLNGRRACLKMAGMLTARSNNGFRSEPRSVTRIEDRNGNVIKKFDLVQNAPFPPKRPG
jgi:penicillin-binding protein 1A